MKLIYVFDAYCGWSHGFSGTLREVTARHPEMPAEVVSGGLFTGDRRQAIREFGYVQQANAAISEATGAEFGDGYHRLIADGSFVMDSEAAARGMAALRQAAPRVAVELAIALQRAFFRNGLSLSDPDTYRVIALSAGLDPGAVAAAFDSPTAYMAAEADFRYAARLGVTSYPTLLTEAGGRLITLARGSATAAEVDQRLAAVEPLSLPPLR